MSSFKYSIKNKSRFRNFQSLILSLFFVGFAASCSDEKLGPSIFDTSEETLDPASYTYKFDLFLQNEFLEPYNLQFAYKMKDVAADMDYNLVPASFENSKKLAVLVKYLWFDVYKKIANEAFLKKHGPRMIMLIGSPGYNPANGTELLGLAEGGIKISLLKVNQLNINNVEMLNEFYFKTMHHEFAHILHQTKNYPVEFNLISYKNYDPYNWQERQNEIAWSLGYTSPYGSSQTREDFVEVIANYIVKTDADWNTMLQKAAKEWVYNEATETLSESTTETDGVNGAEVIQRKLTICRLWLKDAWGINLDQLRAEVQTRQANIDINALLAEIEK